MFSSPLFLASFLLFFCFFAKAKNTYSCLLEKKSTFFPRVSVPKRESEKKSKDVFFWSDDESAEKTDREERFFVGFDREERRYLFHTHSSEIEFE